MSDKQSAQASIAATTISNIILERHLIGAIPQNRLIPLKNIKKLTCCNLSNIHKYVNVDLFTVHKTTIEVTDNKNLLSQKSIDHCKHLIKKFVFPSKYEQDDFVYNIGKLFEEKYYTAEEKAFIDLMFNNLIQIVNSDLASKISDINNLVNFNSINDNNFFLVARNIYNAILQKKIHAGDNIFSYINEVFTTEKMQGIISQKLKSACKYDYFFDENAILKCDFNKNFNLLIKNFINSIIYEFDDFSTRVVLLAKLKVKYPLLICEKNFYEFN